MLGLSPTAESISFAEGKVGVPQEVSSAWNHTGVNTTKRATSGEHAPPRSNVSTEPGLGH